MPVAYGLVDLQRETKTKDHGASQEEPMVQGFSGQECCDVCKMDFEVVCVCVCVCVCMCVLNVGYVDMAD